MTAVRRRVRESAYREGGVAFSVSLEPDPVDAPEVHGEAGAPRRVGQATSVAEALRGRETLAGMAQG